MTSPEVIHELIERVCAVADDLLGGGNGRFALVVWIDGLAANDGAVGFAAHPLGREQVPVALETAARCAREIVGSGGTLQ